MRSHPAVGSPLCRERDIAGGINPSACLNQIHPTCESTSNVLLKSVGRVWSHRGLIWSRYFLTVSAAILLPIPFFLSHPSFLPCPIWYSPTSRCAWCSPYVSISQANSLILQASLYARPVPWWIHLPHTMPRWYLESGQGKHLWQAARCAGQEGKWKHFHTGGSELVDRGWGLPATLSWVTLRTEAWSEEELTDFNNNRAKSRRRISLERADKPQLSQASKSFWDVCWYGSCASASSPVWVPAASPGCFWHSASSFSELTP